jgi:hypothetical protein
MMCKQHHMDGARWLACCGCDMYQLIMSKGACYRPPYQVEACVGKCWSFVTLQLLVRYSTVVGCVGRREAARAVLISKFPLRHRTSSAYPSLLC